MSLEVLGLCRQAVEKDDSNPLPGMRDKTESNICKEAALMALYIIGRDGNLEELEKFRKRTGKQLMQAEKLKSQTTE